MIASVALALLFLGGRPGGPPSVKWEHRFEEAMKKARTSGKPVMVDFWADWCGWCHRLDQTTYVDPVVVRLSEEFVAVKVDTEGGHKQAEVALKYNVSTLPTIAFLTPSGRQVTKLNGFQGPGQFPKTMESAREAALKVMAWETAVEKDSANALALFRLGVHLFEQEFYEDSRSLLDRAARVDGQRPVMDRKQARMLIGIIQKYDHRYAEAESVLKDGLSLQPITEFDPKMLYILGRVYMSWEKPEEARRSFQRILAEFPETAIAKKAREGLDALGPKKKATW